MREPLRSLLALVSVNVKEGRLHVCSSAASETKETAQACVSVFSEFPAGFPQLPRKQRRHRLAISTQVRFFRIFPGGGDPLLCLLKWRLLQD